MTPRPTPKGRKYRDSLAIAAQILSASRSGARKTSIMYRAALSSDQLRRYLRRLVELGLLEFDAIRTAYTATPKGLSFLQHFTELAGITEALGAKRVALENLLYDGKRGDSFAGAKTPVPWPSRIQVR